MQVIIMAGGEGSRLRPLTCDRPKPMVPVLNKPVMEHAIDLCKKHGLTDIGVTLQYMPEEIKDYFGDGSDFGVSLKYFVEETPLGTAGSVKNASKYLKETFVVVSGDALTDINLTAVLAYHKRKKSMATLILKSVDVPLEYGVVITDTSGRITRFLEKPSWGEVFSDTVNTGIYILEPEVLSYVAAGQKFDFSQDLFPQLLAEEKPMYGCVVDGYWCDIGDLGQYQSAQQDVLEGKIKVLISGREISPGVIAGTNTHIHPSAKLTGPVVIGNNCVIGANAKIDQYTIIGDNCTIDEGASIKRCVLWKNVMVGKQAELRKAVLCNQVRIQDGAAVFEGSVIGDRTVIEAHCKIKTDVKIWPHKKVESGAIVSTNYIWGQKGTKKVFGFNGLTGAVNIDITPEYASKLAAAYGSTLGQNAQVTVSSDMAGASQMVKKAVIAGLMSAGVKSFDMGILATPIHRYAIRAVDVNGGIHIKESSASPDKLTLYFLNEFGSNISKGVERKIENLFVREDFARAGSGQIGKVVYMPDMIDSYLEHLTANLNLARIKQLNIKMVISYDNQNLLPIVPPLLDELGCALFSMTDGYQPNKNNQGLSRLVQRSRQVAEEVTRRKAHLGVILDSNAEELILIDNQGRIVGEDLLMALISLIILKSGDGAKVAVPVTAPAIFEKMAAKYKGQVIRTKTAPQFLMEEMLKPEIYNSSVGLPQFFLHFDAISALARILDFMTEEKISLAQMVDQVPDFHMTVKSTKCSWSSKGKVMRQLIEEKKSDHVELIDGIKVYHEDGWALVLPDAEGPFYHVYSEASNYEFSEELANMYINRIDELKV